MISKFPRLRGLIAERGVRQTKIAQALGISYRSFHNKMVGNSSFIWEEVCIIHDRFFPDISKDELFKTK